MSAANPENNDSRLERAGASDESIQAVHANLAHNRVEPAEGYSPLPLFLLGFISALIFVGAIYIVRNRAGFDPLAYDERFDPRTLAAVTETKIDPVAQGKKLFNSGGACVTCHQATGTGVPGVYPPLAKSEWVNGSEERVIRIVLQGLTGSVTVAGNTFNNNMPAFGPGGGYNWTDDKIAYVLTYVRQEWGNTAPAITPEKVAEIRTKVAADRKTPWTAPELEAIK